MNFPDNDYPALANCTWSGVSDENLGTFCSTKVSLVFAVFTLPNSNCAAWKACEIRYNVHALERY